MLPDGRILKIESWFEVFPPKPEGLCLVEHYPGDINQCPKAEKTTT
jgi:hypothetical protein